MPRNAQTSLRDLLLNDYDEEQLTCRYPHHRDVNVGAWYVTYDRKRYIMVRFNCPCGSVRTDTLNTDGTIAFPSKRTYPEGYLMKGRGRVGRAPFRRATLDRMSIGNEAPDNEGT